VTAMSAEARALIAQAIEQGHGATVTDPVALARVARIVRTDAVTSQLVTGDRRSA
jgi:hypothetical protein